MAHLCTSRAFGERECGQPATVCLEMQCERRGHVLHRWQCDEHVERCFKGRVVCRICREDYTDDWSWLTILRIFEQVPA